jgi:hypothetical protein
MSCPFCELFAGYEHQAARRQKTGTLVMSEDNARLLIHLAAQIRTVTRATLHLVEQEAVPTMLCDLFDAIAEGLLDELGRKLLSPAGETSHPASFPADPPSFTGKRSAPQAG